MGLVRASHDSCNNAAHGLGPQRLQPYIEVLSCVGATHEQFVRSTMEQRRGAAGLGHLKAHSSPIGNRQAEVVDASSNGM